MNKPFNLDQVCQAARQKNIIWRRHALERMLERGFSREMVMQVILTGKVIEDYSVNRPMPSALLLGWDSMRPIHVVVSIQNDQVAIITVYEPTLDVFEPDYQTRRKR